MEVNISGSKRDAARTFSEYLVNVVSKNETTHIALSGGSTPKEVFKELALNFKDAIDWSTVQFYWGDERCVPPDDGESNYKMADEYLFSKVGLSRANIHRIYGENDPVVEAKRYSEILKKRLPYYRELPQFDLVILGLGDDGHTASIFPHQMKLFNSKKYCEVAEHPETGQKRVTLTGQIINNASEVAFLVTGTSKAQKVFEIIEMQGNYERYPASFVLPRSGKLIWFLDADAAGILRRS